jgi:hypothetical protein
MPSAARRDPEPFEVTGGRKPPMAETNRRPHAPGKFGPSASSSPSAAAEVAKSIPNTITFPALLPAQERLLNAREVAAHGSLGEMGTRSHHASITKNPRRESRKSDPLQGSRY